MLSWASGAAFACHSAWAAKHRPPHIHKHTLMLVKHLLSCICIWNKQEIVFICMQMLLSPRQRFWIKSFTIPLIPNYSQAQTRTAIFAVTERISTEGGSSSQNSRVWLGCVSVPSAHDITIWPHPVVPRLIGCALSRSSCVLSGEEYVLIWCDWYSSIFSRTGELRPCWRFDGQVVK